MNERPDYQLVDVFVELADTLVGDFDVVGFCLSLTEHCVELLDVAQAGLMLADARGELQVLAASSEDMHLLELFQLQNQQGPCLECFNSGRAVQDDLRDERWPVFAPRGRAAGFRAVHALPMRLREQTIGALNLFRSTGGVLDGDDLLAAQAMADIATVGLLQERAVRESRVLAEQLQGALNSRVAIEQAKGVLAEHSKLEMGAAFALLRSYARSHNRRLDAVAAGVIDGSLLPEVVRAADR